MKAKIAIMKEQKIKEQLIVKMRELNSELKKERLKPSSTKIESQQ